MRISTTTTTYGSSALEVFAGSRGLEASFTATVDLAQFVRATVAPNGYLPAGLHVSWATEDAGLLKDDGDIATEFAGILTDPHLWPKDSAGAYVTTGVLHVAIVAGFCDLYEQKLEVAPSVAAKADAIAAGVVYRRY